MGQYTPPMYYSAHSNAAFLRSDITGGIGIMYCVFQIEFYQYDSSEAMSVFNMN